MNLLKSIIGGMEQPSENYSIAEQAKPIAESRYQENNLASTNNYSNNKKKTRKVATIVRPRRIMVQKTPKSMKKRVTNLENTVNTYGSKINNYIEGSKTQQVEKEEFVYIPITFKRLIGLVIDGIGPMDTAYGYEPMLMVRSNTEYIKMSPDGNNNNLGECCDIDAILQLKNLKKILIDKRQSMPHQFIYKGSPISPGGIYAYVSITEFIKLFKDNGIELEFY